MKRKVEKAAPRVVRLGDAKRLTRGIFGEYLEVNMNLQTIP